MPRRIKQSKTLQEAFTLVELLVVIAIITVMIGLLLPALAAARNLAYNIICQSNMRQITLSYILYAQENEGMAPPNYVGGGSTGVWNMVFVPAGYQYAQYGSINDLNVPYMSGGISMTNWSYPHLPKAYICPMAAEDLPYLYTQNPDSTYRYHTYQPILQYYLDSDTPSGWVDPRMSNPVSYYYNWGPLGYGSDVGQHVAPANAILITEAYLPAPTATSNRPWNYSPTLWPYPPNPPPGSFEQALLDALESSIYPAPANSTRYLFLHGNSTGPAMNISYFDGHIAQITANDPHFEDKFAPWMSTP